MNIYYISGCAMFFLVMWLIIFIFKMVTDNRAISGGALCLFCFGIIFLFVGSVPGEDINRNIIFGFTVIGFLTIFLAIFILIFLYIKRALKEKERKRNIMQQAKELNEVNLSNKIFEKCIYRRILNINDEGNLKQLIEIANSFGVSDTERAKELYFKGRETSRDLDNREQLTIIEQSKIHGADKYIIKLQEKIQQLTQSAQNMESAAKFFQADAANVRAKQKDWVVAGAIAEGIAGPALGIATALSVQADNARAQEVAENCKQTSLEIADSFYDRQHQREKEVFKVQSIIKNIKEKFIRNGDIDDKFQKITISDVRTSIKANKNIIVCAKLDVNPLTIKVPGILGAETHEAILDGSLKIYVMNSNGIIIGKGYYCAPGFDYDGLSTILPKSIGFGEIKSINVTCIVYDRYYKEITEDDNFTCKIEPVDMWIIDRGCRSR